LLQFVEDGEVGRIVLAVFEESFEVVLHSGSVGSSSGRVPSVSGVGDRSKAS
jgi:hypothetical protein